MIEGVLRSHDLEKSVLSEAVKKFTSIKATRSHEVELLEAEIDRKSEGLEGFLSIVKRVEVSYRCHGDPKRHRVSFIVKESPPNGFQSTIIKSCRAFERERAFYEVFVPMMRQALQTLPHSGDHTSKIELPLPNLLHAVSKGDEGFGDVIILEDLSAEGYRLPHCISKVRGLDLDHCLVAMRTIGRFHALVKRGETLVPRTRTVGGMAHLIHRMDRLFLLGGFLDKLFDRSRGMLSHLIQRLKRWRALYRTVSAAEKFLMPSGDKHSGVLGMIPELSRDAMWYDSDRGQEPSIFHGVVEKRLSAIRDIAKQLDGLPRKAEESGLLGAALGRLWSVLNRSASASRSGWNVLNHGDCWINNMLFRYGGEGGEKPVDAKLIDLQFSRYCHPGIDLLYFLYTSTHRSFRERHFDLLIAEYHESLARTLGAIDPDCVPMSLEDLKLDLRGEFQPFGVIIGTVFAPYLKLETDPVENAEHNAHEEFIKNGNSSSAVLQFRSNAMFRSFMEENVRELTEVIFPDGLGVVNPYWV